jgi:hypothetical protein
MDTKLSPTQAVTHRGAVSHHDAVPHRDGDVVVLAPKDWTDAEEALSRLAHVASDRRRPAAGSDFSAGPRVSEPSLDATLHPANLNNASSPTDRPAPGRRGARRLAAFLATACIGVAATLAWQSYGGAAKQVIASSVPQLDWLLTPPAMDQPSGREIAVEQPGPPAVAAAAPQPAAAPAAAVAPAAPEPAASRAPTGPAPELQQLATMAHDLAALRQSVEQLASGQEQMARDIAKLQTAGQEIRRRVSALPPAAATTARKPVPPPQPAFQSSAAPPPPMLPEPAPASSSATPLPPAPPEPPLRPPMPVR